MQDLIVKEVYNSLKNELIVKEIFHSLQGEGARAGENSIFIRLANCNLNCAFCDTDWKNGVKFTLDEITEKIKQFKSNWIIWTGGEPTLQLNSEIVSYFKKLGYKQAIETNGTNKVPAGLDYVVCSPKVPPHKLRENFSDGLNEIRLPVVKGMLIPLIETLPKADYYYLSPIFDGSTLNRDNLNYCLQIIMKEPRWRLSIQQHKIWSIP